MRPTRRRKLGIGCGALLALFAVLFLALPTRKVLFHKHYDIVSIASLSDYKDETRMARARAEPAVSSYPWPPIFQANGSLCGPTSLANVFRSFGEAGATATSVLAGTGKCSTGMCFMGLTLDELAEIARHGRGYRVTVLRDLSLSAFRRELREGVANLRRRYVVNFDRGPLFGKEAGHHSPIGGYLDGDDLVLVLDVNAKFAPWLVNTERLFTAVDTVDDSSGQKRGLLLIERE